MQNNQKIYMDFVIFTKIAAMTNIRYKINIEFVALLVGIKVTSSE